MMNPMILTSQVFRNSSTALLECLPPNITYLKVCIIETFYLRNIVVEMHVVCLDIMIQGSILWSFAIVSNTQQNFIFADNSTRNDSADSNDLDYEASGGVREDYDVVPGVDISKPIGISHR